MLRNYFWLKRLFWASSFWFLIGCLEAKPVDSEIRNSLSAFLHHIKNIDTPKGQHFGNQIDPSFRSEYWPDFNGNVNELAESVFLWCASKNAPWQRT